MSATVRVGALLWVLCLQFFLGQFIAQLAWPAYSMVIDDISVLGATVCGAENTSPDGTAYVCSPLNLVFNASLALQGVLSALGAILTWSAWPRSRMTAVGLSLAVIGGVGTAMAGIFPYNVNLPLHGLGALTDFTLANIGFILLGVVLTRHGSRALGSFSIAAGIVSLAAFVLYVSGVHFGVRGIVERFVAYPQTVWYVVMGIAILSNRVPAFGHGRHN